VLSGAGSAHRFQRHRERSPAEDRGGSEGKEAKAAIFHELEDGGKEEADEEDEEVTWS